MRKEVCREKDEKCNPPGNSREGMTSIICIGSASRNNCRLFFFFLHQPLNCHFWNVPRKTWKKKTLLKAYLPSSPGKTTAPKCLCKSNQRYPRARQPGWFYPEKKGKCIQTGDFHETVYWGVGFCSQLEDPSSPWTGILGNTIPVDGNNLSKSPIVRLQTNLEVFTQMCTVCIK